MNTLNIAIESAKLLCEDLQRTLEHDTSNPLLSEIVIDQLMLANSIRQKLERCHSLILDSASLPLRAEFCAWCPDPKNPSPLFHPDGSVEHAPMTRDACSVRRNTY